MKIITITNTKKQDYLSYHGINPIAEYKNCSEYLNTPRLKELLETYQIQNYLFKNKNK